MKKIGMKALALSIAMATVLFTGCIYNDNSTSNNNNGENGGNDNNTTVSEIYKDFANYPTGKENSTGTLTLANQVNSEVLVFTSSVTPENYIGTIPASSSIKVKLDANKFYNIVAVQKSAYDQKQELAAQTTKLAYYSDTQAYRVSVSPENLTGSAKWVFNNSTNYWVSIEHVDNSGNTFAVIAPKARRVVVPMANGNYDYKIVYKQELKLNGVTMALVEKSLDYQNDTASFSDTKNLFTTNLSLDEDTSAYDNLLPSVKFTNNTKKSIRVYKGQIQLSNFGEIDDEDYVLLDGDTAYFTGFEDDFSSVGLKIDSVAFSSPLNCTENVKFKKGFVYNITVANTGTTAKPVYEWTITEKPAVEVYDEEK